MNQYSIVKKATAIAAVIAAVQCGVSAATISNAGAVTDNAGGEVVGWRTSSLNKSFDIDGNNVYGSLGAIIWGDGTGGNAVTAATLTSGTSGAGVLGWSYIGQTVNPDLGIGTQSFMHNNYQQIDNLTASGLLIPGVGSISAGNGTFTFQLNGAVGDYVGRTVRIGFMQDYQEASAGNDGNKLFTLAGPGGSASFTTPLTPNHNVDMYFWDITGVNPGDQFTIIGFSNPASTGQGGLASLGTVSIDISAVPEPTTAALMGLGLSGMLMFRRRNVGM